MSATTRTPTGGTISINDCVITMGNSAGTLQNMVALSTADAEGSYGLTQIYGGPVSASYFKMTDYYDIQGQIDYQVEYVNIDSSTGSITTAFIEKVTGNDWNLGVLTDTGGSSNWPNNIVAVTAGCTVPSGTQWHYRDLAISIEVNNFRMSMLEVYLDTNLIGTIPTGTGAYLFDNGGVGYHSSYGSPLSVKLVGI